MPKDVKSVRVSDYTKRQLGELSERLGASESEIIIMAIDRMYNQETRMRVIITADNKVRCPVHGKLRETSSGDYGAQDPAPCGCAWIWENGTLIAVPSRKNTDA